MVLRLCTLLLALTLVGCEQKPPGLSDRQLAAALERAIRINHLYEGKPGAADSVAAVWREWREEEGITREDLERALEVRKQEPERWYGLITLLESRRDSLFPEKTPSPAAQ